MKKEAHLTRPLSLIAKVQQVAALEKGKDKTDDLPPLAKKALIGLLTIIKGQRESEDDNKATYSKGFPKR